MPSTEHRSTKRRSTLPLAAGALSAACLLFTPPASAQNRMQNETQAPSTQRQSPSPTISDQKLNAAAAAIGHVTSVKQSYQQQLAAAPPSDKERITGEANNAVKKAITDEGISIEEYNSILDAAQNDPTVRQQLVQRIHPSER
jgi:uncharacterized protein DUF4168